MRLADYCGQPTPDGFGEWAGCVLFHDGISVSLLGALGLVAIGWWAHWLVARRRQARADQG